MDELAMLGRMGKGSKHQNTDGELRAAIDHIVYELDMVIFALEVARSSDRNETQNYAGQMTHNMALECFLLHFRILIEFLAPMEATRPVDVRAWEYSREHQTKSYGSDSFRTYDRGGLSRRVAHLTTVRPQKRTYDLLQLSSWLRDAFDEWVNDLDPTWSSAQDWQAISRRWQSVLTDPLTLSQNMLTSTTSSHVIEFGPVVFTPPLGPDE